MTLEEAFALGKKVSRARINHDEATAKFQSDWFRRAIAGEENKVELRTMFDAGYKEEYDQHFAHIKPTIRW